MPITKEYTTEAKLETFLNKSITAGEADDAINQAVTLIDQYTDRNFIADSEASARVFDGTGCDMLEIDECISITKVERGLDEYGDSKEEISAGGFNGYYLLPANRSAENLPIQQIHLRDRYWIKGLQNNQITAKWGFSENVPEPIVLATTILAAGIYMYNRGGASGTVKSEKIGNYSVTYATPDGWQSLDNAKRILETYKRYSL